MHVQRKVLHLSLLVAMALPPLALSAASDEAAQNMLGQQAQTATQAAAGQAEALQNAGESQRLRQRINEAVNEKAVRSRQEKHEGPSDADQDQLQARDQDKLQTQDQDKLQTQDQDKLQTQDQDKLQTQDQDKLQTQDQDKLQTRDQDKLHTQDQDGLPEQDKLQTRDRTRDQDRLMDPYGFEDHSAGQGFNSDASMYQRRGGAAAKGAGISSAGSHSGGSTGRGGGKR